jgi:2-oxoglutarate ferredoxin oxidoreductase subunit alpha
MSRVCRTAIDMLKADGIEIGMVRPQTVFPFPEQAVADAAAVPSCTHVLSVEMSMGQMVEDVQRSVLGQRPVSWYGKCGGDVPTPEEIIDVVKERIG